MKVVLDFYYDDLEQRCMGDKKQPFTCELVIGPYEEEMRGTCPVCGSRLGFFRAFGTESQRAVEVRRWDARVTA